MPNGLAPTQLADVSPDLYYNPLLPRGVPQGPLGATPAPSVMAPQLFGGADWGGEQPVFQQRVSQLLNAAPPEIRQQLSVNQAFRSHQYQEMLWQKHLRGELGRTGQPGTSLHEYGLAADWSWASPQAKSWLYENAPKYGLSFPFPKDDAGHMQLAEYTPGTPQFTGRTLPDGAPLYPDAAQVRVASVTPEAGRMLSPREIYQYALNAGFSPDSGRLMTAIALHESRGGNAYAYNPADPDGGSFGLTQIGGAHPGARTAFGNPQQAMNMAYQISQGGTDFTPWGSYTNGRYRQYLPQVANLQEAPHATVDPATGMLMAPAVPSSYAATPSAFRTGLTATGAPGIAAQPTIPNITFGPQYAQADGAPVGGTTLAAGGAGFQPPGGPIYTSYPALGAPYANAPGGLYTGGAVPATGAAVQTAMAGPGGPGYLPPVTLDQPGGGPVQAPPGGPGGTPHEGGPADDGWRPPADPMQNLPRGAMALALAGAMLRGTARAIPVDYDPFRAAHPLDPSFPGSIVGRNIVDPRSLAEPVPVRPVTAGAFPASPFAQLMATGSHGGRAQGI